MTKTLSTLLCSATILCGLAGSGATWAQTDPYFLLNGDQQTLFKIQGGALVSTTTGIGGTGTAVKYPLAVRSTVWTRAGNDSTASEFTLAGVATGATSSAGLSENPAYDGAATATHNYVANFSNREVVRSNPDFTSPTTIFTLPDGATPIGIAIDATNGDFFIQRNFQQPVIDRYSSIGVLLGTITLGIFDPRALAYEVSTDTLWAVNPENSHVLQFDKTSGAILADLAIPGFTQNNVLGGEMPAAGAEPEAAVVPTLSEWALILFGGLLASAAALLIQRRRPTGA
jgi:hypothetical protein